MKLKNIQYRKLIEITPYDRNPRNNDLAVEKVAASIREFGFNSPIIVDRNFVIIAGHTRYKAAKMLNLEVVPIIVANNLTDTQVKAYRLADNKVAEYSTWELDLLELELDEIDLDMNGFGFDVDTNIGESDNEIVEDDIGQIKVPEQPTSKLGDIYQLGEHKLMCGDSTNQHHVFQLFGDERADLYLTDPPYNVAYEGKTKEALTIQNDNMNDVQFREFLTKAFSTANSVMKEGASFYIWHADSEGYNFRGACLDNNWSVRQCLIWNKNTMVLGRQDYHWKHEPCLYGWKPGAAHQWYSDRKQTTVIDYDKPQRNGEHPTMKPVGLFDYQIKNNTKVGDLVFDSFGGSGTTIIACEQNKRRAFVMELDPKYVDVIIERWELFTGKKAEKVG